MVFSKKKIDGMRIGIDARMYRESGIGRYIRNLIAHLQILDQKNEYFIFLRKPEYENLVYNTENFHKVLADFSWYGFSEQVRFPKLLKKYNLDLVHFPHFNIPVFYKGKFVVTIHDLIHHNFRMQRATTRSKAVYVLKHKAFQYVFMTALKKSGEVITVSDYVKNELVKNWNISKDQVVVTKEAVEENIIRLSEEIKPEEILYTLKKYKIKKPYIFYVGNAHPHKNIRGLIKAFLKIKETDKNLRLVLSGHDHYFWTKIRDKYKHKDVIYTGYIEDRELVALYKAAEIFVIPSLEEGFGIPILEAFACGVPVVSSSAASLPEVGGDACIYFDPKNIGDMVEKIQSTLKNKATLKKLQEKGSARYKIFSWKKLAQSTLKVYNSLCEPKSGTGT